MPDVAPLETVTWQATTGWSEVSALQSLLPSHLHVPESLPLFETTVTDCSGSLATPVRVTELCTVSLF
ncbi:MAG TPA: hypothetical protein VLW85_04860, partial [Myxococcales bacterium]|nr:hypothetical protein [Myxococcales bacterium]